MAAYFGGVCGRFVDACDNGYQIICRKDGRGRDRRGRFENSCQAD